MIDRPVSVIELAAYRRRAEALLTRDEQAAIIDLVTFDPTCGDLIPGTGGLRKVRIGRTGIGKRGGGRVIYFFHDKGMPILLTAIYAKNEKGDLTAAERKDLEILTKEFVIQWKRKGK